MPDSSAFVEVYRDLQRYIDFTEADARRIAVCAELVEPSFPNLVDDFYATIRRHPRAFQVIRGGDAQIARLKQSLTTWLKQLFAGPYDDRYVQARWLAGKRHVEVKLDQNYVTVALARLRLGLHKTITREWRGTAEELVQSLLSLNKLLDLDLAIIENSYQAEFLAQRQQNERLAMLTQLAEFVPILIVREDLSLCYFSPSAQALTGYTSAEALAGQGLLTLVDAEDHNSVAMHVQRTLAGPGSREFECTVRCRDGALRRWMWNARRLDDYEGQKVALIIGYDVTERRIADEQARRKERLAAIGQTVTGLAHESRNALQRSKACLELLTTEVADSPVARELVNRALKAQDHLHQLLEEVRSYAAPITLERRACRLDEVWRETWADLADKRRDRDISFAEDVGDVRLQVEADAFALRQVFRNILENSLDACGQRGQITVRARSATLGKRPAVELVFADSGPGMNAEQRQRIFEPFYTTKTKGTGLGMAIASRIVEAHGGQIGLGNPTKGAEIVVTLPRNA